MPVAFSELRDAFEFISSDPMFGNSALGTGRPARSIGVGGQCLTPPVAIGYLNRRHRSFP
jgi:hypothetical protein